MHVIEIRLFGSSYIFGNHFQSIIHTLKGFSRDPFLFFLEINTSKLLVEHEVEKLKIVWESPGSKDRVSCSVSTCDAPAVCMCVWWRWGQGMLFSISSYICA